LSAVRLLLLLGELERSETTTLMPAVGLRLPPRDDDSLLSEPSEVLERVSDDFRSFPRRKNVLILFLRPSPPSSSSYSSSPPPSLGNRVRGSDPPPPPPPPTLGGGVGAGASSSTEERFLPRMRSLSLLKAEWPLSFMARLYMLAVRLLRVNCTVACTSPRSFSFLPVLEFSRNQRERRLTHSALQGHEGGQGRVSVQEQQGQHKNYRNHYRNNKNNI
jgi:hypothetical protein